MYFLNGELLPILEQTIACPDPREIQPQSGRDVVPDPRPRCLGVNQYVS